ncbi:MAG: MBL fold metallo-hydrolase [Oscillospiraceae bacterium]|nr:MBL fold metallo-hydrolase [Oscillospiraceae bacterium]
MRLVVLSDNIPKEPCQGEWGLCIYIEYRGHKLLLDTGSSGLFAQNAEVLGLDLSQVEFGVLSHAHYDHADGLADFFALNDRAPFYLRSECRENCWCDKGEGPEYIGIHQGWLTRFRDRLIYSSGKVQLLPGVYLLPHSSPGLAEVGRKAGMFVSECCGLVPDEFAHEQSLVLESAEGLIILNSCCHAGADVIIREAAEAFPGRTLKAIIGGLHLYRSAEEEVRELARAIKRTGISSVVTGHCTGEAGLAILKDELGDALQALHAGLELTYSD